MKTKKLFTGLLLCLLCTLVIGAISVSAASLKIKLTPDTKEPTHERVFVDVTVSSNTNNISKIEYQKGKIKKTSNKSWKKAEELSFYYDKKTKIADSSFRAGENGYYTVRVTDKSGKKTLKSIKIKNLLPCSERSSMAAYITDYTGPDSNGDYTLTFTYKKQLSLTASDLKGKRVGDTILAEGKKVMICELKTMNKKGDIVSKKKYDSSIQCVVVMPDQLSDFYDLNEDEYLIDNPEAGKFGFIKNRSGMFMAYSDYDYWEDGGDYYVALETTVYSDVKLKANKDTRIIPMLSNPEKFNDYSISFTDFLSVLMGGAEKMNEMGITISTYAENRVYEVYDEKTGTFTDYISEIRQIYSP